MNFLTYFAESALERSVCLADNLIDGIAESLIYDDDDFVDSVIAELGSNKRLLYSSYLLV